MAWEATFLLSPVLLLLLDSGEDRGQGQREGARLRRGQGAGGVHNGALCLVGRINGVLWPAAGCKQILNIDTKRVSL